MLASFISTGQKIKSSESQDPRKLSCPGEPRAFCSLPLGVLGDDRFPCHFWSQPGQANLGLEATEKKGLADGLLASCQR